MTYDLNINVRDIVWRAIVDITGTKLQVTCPLCGEVQTTPMDTINRSERDWLVQVRYYLAQHLRASGVDHTPGVNNGTLLYTCPGVVFLAVEHTARHAYDAIIHGVGGRLWRWSVYEDTYGDDQWDMELLSPAMLTDQIDELASHIKEQQERLALLQQFCTMLNGTTTKEN